LEERIMLRVLLWAALVLVPGPALWALDDPATPSQAYAALVKEVQAAQSKLAQEYQTAKEEKDKDRILEAYYDLPRQYYDRFLKLAQDHPKDPVAVSALLWVSSNGKSSPKTDAARKPAVELLLKDHLESPRLAALAQGLSTSTAPEAEAQLRTILEKSPHREAQGQAALGLATYFKSEFERLGQAGKPGREKFAKEAEKALKTVAEKYGDVKRGSETLGAAAKAMEFDLKNLAVGNVAMDIEAEDIDGKTFKLSDYRGKVVVLDFWGHW